MEPAAVETTVGIATYLTSFSGIQGKLRTIPEDFIVQELPLNLKPNLTGTYTIAWVKSTNWDTHLLVRQMSKRLQVSSKRISFAGTKDKRAVTTQLMSFFNIAAKQLEDLAIKDVVITPLHTSKKPITLGKLKGNHFDIIIRNIKDTITKQHIQQYTTFFTKTKGFPNYFGIQRFGSIRPITHLVGKYIIRGEFEQAVMIYLAKAYPEEPSEISEMRRNLTKTHDFAEALASFPIHLHFERAMLSALQHNPTDFKTALLALPKNLLLMFINAYQSYLFNKIISMRLLKGIPLDSAIPGDIIISNSHPSRNKNFISATPSNIDKVNHQIEKQHALVSGILVGTDPLYAEGEMGEIEHTILEQETIDTRLFFIPEIPFLSSSGTRRNIYAPVGNLKTQLIKDAQNEGKQALHLNFNLGKGCYATSFLREWMKSKEVRDY